MSRKKGRYKKRYHRTLPLRNSFERVVYDYLRKKYGSKNIKYESEEIPYVIEYKYIPDFCVYDKDEDKIIYFEAKGKFDERQRRKMLAVVNQHPDKTFVMVFQKNNKIRKGSKIRYSDWCDRNNIKYKILKDKYS